MSKVDDLIQELCPDGVQRVALSEVAQRQKGMPITATKMKELAETPGMLRIYAGGQTQVDVDPRLIEEKYIINEPSVIVRSRGYIDFARSDGPFTHKNEMWSYSVKDARANISFIYYYLLTQRPALQLHAQATSVKLPQLSVADTDHLQIPLPPLEVQEEIARILDQFVELDRELEQEIAGRTVQFNQVREDLISGASFPRVPVGSLATRVSTGATPKAGESRYYQDGDIPWLRTGEVNFGEVWETEKLITQAALDETNVSWIAEHCVIVAISGATAGRVAVNKIPMTTNQHCCNMQINPEQADYRFVFHALAASYEDLKAQGRGARGDLNTSIIKGFKIPLPPIEVQEEIASQLDTFTEYIDNLKRERELRQKQYEHYRDQLLDFPVKE